MPLGFELLERDVSVVGATGETSSDIRSYLPMVSYEEFPMLGSIDEYGRTYFNSIQVPHLLAELAQLRERGLRPQQENVIDRIEELCRGMGDRAHRMIRVTGD